MLRLILFFILLLTGSACKESISLDVLRRGICEGENCSTYRAPAFALSMQTDGTYTRDINPRIRWQTGEENSYATYRLKVGLDATCSRSIRELALSEREIGLGLLDEGNYFLCLEGVTRNDLILPAENNGLRLVVDRTPPQLVAAPRLYLNSSRTPDVAIDDANLADCQWSSTPAGLYIGQSSDPLTPIWSGSDGVYPLSLTCRDRAGNSAQLSIEVVWDTKAPVLTPMSPITTYSPLRLAPLVNDPDATYEWSIVSAPANGDLTFDDPKRTEAEIRATTVGTYQLRLAARDLAGNSSEQDLTVMWLSVPELLVNAGPDFYARQTSTLQGTVANSTSLQWTQLSGPGVMTFSDASLEDPTITASVDGTYVLQLTASDSSKTLTDTVTVVWDTVPPTVNAGSDQSARSTLMLNASSSGAATFTWTRISGPGTVGFSAPNAEDTQVTASADGTYILRLTATDLAGNSASDDMQLTWDTTPPSVNAGPDRSAAALITLDGSAPGASTYAWSQASGPGVLSFGSSNAEDTTVTASVDGTYTIRLSVTDALGNSANDTMQLTWDTTPPVVNAGPDRSAASSITLDGSAPGATSFAWAQVSGPGTLSFGTATTEDSTVSASVDGSYVIRLTASDALGNSANDTMTLTWDTTAPAVNAGPDRSANALITLDATVTGATSFAWTMVSGPGTISFGTASAEDTTVTATADGVYILRLTAADALGNSANDTMQLTWDATAPSVNAGVDRSAAALITLDATVTGATTFAWTMVSGPGTLTFGTASAEDTTVTASVDGSYTVRLTATDALGNSANDTMILTWDTTPPSVNAGPDRTATASITLDGSAPGATTFTWSQVSGPGTLTFGTANAENTTVSATLDGSYTIRLTAADALGNSANDTMILTWDTTPPTVNAGADIVSNSLYSIDATSSGASTFAWSKVSGPGTITFGSASSENTTVTASSDGTYILRLTATDAAGLSTSDDVQLIWDTTAPTVDAGVDLQLNASTTINATVTGASTYAWTQRSGPGTVTFGSASAEDTTVSASLDGTYVLRLTASDAAGNSAFDELTLTWDTTSPTATMNGQPSGSATDSVLNINIGGTGVTHYRYAIITGAAICSSASYSGSILVTTAITDNITALPGGTVTVCVRGLDSLGNTQSAAAATSTSWTRTVGGTTATVPAGLSVTTGDTVLALTWTKDVSQSGFVVLRKATAVSETLADGNSYTVGQVIGGATVVYVGSVAQFANAALTNGTTYHYAVFAHDSSTRYTTGTATSGSPFSCQGTGGGPTAPSFITATAGKTRNYVNWGVGGTGTSGYLILRSLGTPVCNVPASGTSYTVGQALGTSTVVYKGTLEAFNDSSLTNGQLYHYMVYAYNSSNQYSTGVTTSVVPRDFALAGTFTNAGYNAGAGQASHFVLADKGVAYMAAEDRGIKTFDISTPLAPQTTFPAYTSNNFGAGGASYLFDKKGSYLYVGDYNEGLRIVDATTPKTSLTVVGSLILPAITGVFVDGNYAYMTSEESQGNGANAKRVGGLRIANVTTPASPSAVSSLQTDGAVGLEVQKLGNYVYVSYRNMTISPASTWQGIKVYNVSNPAAPSEVAALPLQSVEGLRIFGSYLLATVANVSSGHDGIHIYSLANPASPSLVGSTTIGETSELIDVTVLGDYAFATSYNSKMIEVFDISNKASPSNTTSMSTSTFSPLYINNDGQRILHTIQFGGFDMTTVFAEETVPMPPEAQSLTRGSGTATFTWRSGGGSTSSYIVLRSATPITTAPTNGVTYTVGQSLGSATVVASGTATTHTESSIPSGQGYYLAVYAVDGSLVYSSAPARAFAY